jgi:DNA polymerase III alpha subunit (gram-positive type)
MRLPYDLIVFDLEANQPSGEIIEIGAVRVLRDGTIADTFQALINPNEKLSSFITKLTGITDKMLENCKQFEPIAAQFAAWAKASTTNVILASWSSYDTNELRNAHKVRGVQYPFRGKSIDIKSIGTWVALTRGMARSREGLATALEQWDIPPHGEPHRALNDAMDTANLFVKWWESQFQIGTSILNKLKELGIR